MKRLTMLLVNCVIIIYILTCSKSPTPPPVQYGFLAITVYGLPAYLDADIAVSNTGSYSVKCISDTILSNVPVGTIAIESKNVVDTAGDTIRASMAFQQVIVNENDTSFVDVHYIQPNLGQLIIDISGLPPGIDADVQVSDGGTPLSITESTSLNNLNPGAYLVTAENVVCNNNFEYEPDPVNQTVNVVAGMSITASVQYEAKYGRLALAISGLPQGQDADIRVYPGGQPTEYLSVIGSSVLDSLEEGIYWIDARDIITSGGATYAPQPQLQNVTITAGSESSASVRYESFGVLKVTIEGLPDTLDADVTVEPLDGLWSIHLAEDMILDSLKCEDHVIYALEVVEFDGMVYSPQEDTQVVSVICWDTTEAVITYEPKYGRMMLDIVLLEGSTGEGDVSVYNSESEVIGTFAFDAFLDSLIPGSYLVEGKPIESNESDSLCADPDSQYVDVMAGDTARVLVEYFLCPKFRLLYGPLGGDLSFGTWGAGWNKNVGDPNTYEWDFAVFDTVSDSLDGFEYEDNCVIVGPDVTESGFSYDVMAGGPENNNGQTMLSVQSLNDYEIEIRASAYAEANAIGDMDGKGSVNTRAILSADYDYHPFLVWEFGDPGDDSLMLVFNWDFGGIVEYTPEEHVAVSPNWQCNAKIFMASSHCSMDYNMNPPLLFLHSGSESDQCTGSDTLWLKGNNTMIGIAFTMVSNAAYYVHLDPYGNLVEVSSLASASGYLNIKAIF